ncbi:MAG TPA: cation:proton antiporter [Azospirillaceae bacterium]|nr:cation:proton antiporter [Azospirillaceae bacterium]
MHSTTSLLSTIVASLVFAFALGFAAHRLRLPPLVGYLAAGIAIGPFTPGFVADTNLAGQLAEVGVILLMFGVGLHFSLRDLVSVHAVAVPGALGQMAVCILVCIALAHLWGWSFGAGVLLGLALSVASTVVLLRMLDQRGRLDTPAGRIAVGWLIVQDLAMVVVLVLLPPLARGGGATDIAWAMAVTLGKVALFALLVVAVGRRVVPWFLAIVARTGSRELFTLSVLASALGIAYGSAALFGVSFALGAFFAGVVLSESDLSHQAAADSLPFQDAFAVIFFVSVGMLFDPTILMREPLRVLAVAAVVVVVKSAAAVAVVLATRRPLHASLEVAAGLGQVGEFSFILATLGVGLDLLPAEGRDLILAGALISIALNLPLLASADRLALWFDERPALRGWAERRAAPQAPWEADPNAGRLSGHVVLVGHGRVGALIARILAEEALPFIVVERNRRIAEDLRNRGLTVVWGEATAADVLEAAGISRARLLVLAAPDRLQARRVLETARTLNPGLDAVVRTHTDADLTHMESQGVGLAVMGEREMALAMADYTLRTLGVPDGRAQHVVRALRTLARVGLDVADVDAGVSPELRPHRNPDDSAAGEGNGAPAARAG